MNKELLYAEQCYEEAIKEYIDHMNDRSEVEGLCEKWLLLRHDLETKVTHWCFKIRDLRRENKG